MMRIIERWKLMELKQEVLALFMNHHDEVISGQEIANRLSFSRTAIWKVIKQLREEGYPIESIGNKVYRLCQVRDPLSRDLIIKALHSDYQKIQLEIYPQVDSTNTRAKVRAIEGAQHGHVILADEQTRGHGRFGRPFYSPKGEGLYMSLILRPQMHLSQSVYVTMQVAVLICRVLERLTHQAPSIKWVNDIYLGDKKVCGILTEAVTDFETGQVQYMILGIGLNVWNEEFPDELKQIATALTPLKTTRNEICAALLNEVLPISSSFSFDEEILVEYKRRSNVLGKTVEFVKNRAPIEGVAEDIDETGGLIVRLQNGEVETLHSGEVSIRRK